jgi:dienelactone hydrolase
MKIGVVGMSAGAEHAASAATEYGAFEGGNNARPDFVGY